MILRIGFFNVLLLLMSSVLHAETIDVSTEQRDKNSLELSFKIQLTAGEYLYQEGITFSVDRPGVTLSEWTSIPHAQQKYDNVSKETKAVFENEVLVRIQAKKRESQDIRDARVHFTYYTNKYAYPLQKIVPLSFFEPEIVSPEALTKKQQATSPQLGQKNLAKPTSVKKEKKKDSLSSWVSSILKRSNSLPVRILLVFLLGLLLSLTPCIYPMIPVTIGILQAQGSSSLLRNFALALAYTLGMATTYACFGLLAGSVGPLCGHIMSHPITIVLLVLLMAYFAFSMFDFYNMYTPKFMRQHPSVKRKGSYISSFIFGAVSGTIASPCVSPGLALVLGIVATLGNMFWGFVLLFAFGAGLSFPLLIIGTFSNSIQLLPRAGSWMIEIKKFFGLLLLALCFYYLSTIIPWNILLFPLASSCTVGGIYYFYLAQKTTSGFFKKFNNIIGFILCAASMVLFVQAYQSNFMQQSTQTGSNYEQQSVVWHTDYQAARAQAMAEGKKLFIDFWATWCSICTTINNTTLKDAAVVETLQQFVLVKVDGSSGNNEPYATLQKQFSITGFPTFLIVEPENETIIKRWTSEIYSMPRTTFIEKLKARV